MALGRGLGALIPDIETINNESSEFFYCDIDGIRPNPYQPRTDFAEAELRELADSIKENGVIQPLLIRNTETGYELIVGERRLRASRLAGLRHIPAVVRDVSDIQMLEIAIIENVQRENLNPIEEADAYHRLLEEFEFTQEQLAERVGKSRSSITNLLRLRQLPDPIKNSLVKGVISSGHARALLGLEDTDQQHKTWQTVIEKKLSVRETEALIRRLKTHQPELENPATPRMDSSIMDLMSVLSRQLGTAVKIKKKGEKGKVEIDFKSNDDFQRLIGILRQLHITEK